MDMTVKDPTTLHNLRNLPVFLHCTSHELVHLLPHIQEEEFPAGQVLYQSGAPAKYLYFVLRGGVKLTQGSTVRELPEGFFGEEAAIAAKTYLWEARTTSPSLLWMIPAESLKSVLAKNATVMQEFYASLMSHFSGEASLVFAKDTKAKGGSKPVSNWELLGWALSVFLPMLIWFVTQAYGFEIKARFFLVVFASITSMWVFRLTAEFIPCILGVLALLILGVAPANEILQGFSSSEFFMAMSIFGVGAVLVTSGLTFRAVLLMLKYIPPSSFFHSLALIFAGFVMTPVLPSANGRVGLAGPIMIDMLTALEYQPKGKASTQIAVATFTGFTLFASVFLTSKPINFVVYGLLPMQVQEQFQWSGWIYGAGVSAITMMTLTLISMAIWYRNDEKPKLSKHHIDAQLAMLGPLSILEWTSLVAVAIFVFGTALSSFHKVDPPWVAMAVLILLLAMEALGKKEFHEKVDWSFILYLAGLIGLVKTMSAVGIESMIAKQLTFVGPLMQQNFAYFVLILFVAISLVRLIVPNNATIAMFCTILLPLAQTSGINPWVVGYLVLTFSDGWMFPFQCTYYLLFLETTEKKNLYDATSLWYYQILTNVFRLIGVMASIPFWKQLGMI